MNPTMCTEFQKAKFKIAIVLVFVSFVRVHFFWKHLNNFYLTFILSSRSSMVSISHHLYGVAGGLISAQPFIQMWSMWKIYLTVVILK